MSDVELAHRTVTTLASALPAAARPAGGSQRRPLYELVARTFADHDEDAALRDFVANPANSSLVMRLLTDMIRADPTLRTRLNAQMSGSTAGTRVAAHGGGVVQHGNTVGGSMAGRDIHQNSNNRRSTSYGGIVMAVLAIAVVVAVLVIGKTVVLPALDTAAHAGGLSGSSTCRDYLASADQEGKVSVMKQLYLHYNKPHLAADPFIIQNTEYFCGNSPNTTLDRLAQARSDG